MTTARRSFLRLLGAVLLGGAAGCDAAGSGEVLGERLELVACAGEGRVFEPFEMPLTFLGVVREGDLAILRASPASRLAPDDDQIVIVVPDVEVVREAIRTSANGSHALALGPAAVSSAPDPGIASLGLSLHARCPKAIEPLVAASGEISFTALGTRAGDRVRATLSFELADARSLDDPAGPAILGTGFTGTLDFEVRVGTPYQLFSDPEAQSGKGP